MSLNNLFFRITDLLISFPYWYLVTFAIAGFIILLAVGRMRHLIFHFHKSGATFGFIIGVALMLFLNLVIIFGLSDKEKLRKVFTKEGGKQALGEAMASGVNNLTNVLGASTFVTVKKPKNAEEVLLYFLALPVDEANKVRENICR